MGRERQRSVLSLHSEYSTEYEPQQVLPFGRGHQRPAPGWTLLQVLINKTTKKIKGTQARDGMASIDFHQRRYNTGALTRGGTWPTKNRLAPPVQEQPLYRRSNRKTPPPAPAATMSNDCTWIFERTGRRR